MGAARDREHDYRRRDNDRTPAKRSFRRFNRHPFFPHVTDESVSTPGNGLDHVRAVAEGLAKQRDVLGIGLDINATIVAVMGVAAAALLVTHQSPPSHVPQPHKAPRVSTATGPAATHLPTGQDDLLPAVGDRVHRVIALPSIPAKVQVPVRLPVDLPVPLPPPPDLPGL